jgi:hypothetical protein
MPSADESQYVITAGSYLCRITGNSNLIKLIPKQWEKYKKEIECPTKTINLCLEEGKIESMNGIQTDGWIMREVGEYHQAVNFHHGKAFLEILYRDDRNVIIKVARALDSYVRIGIHYGLMMALHQECVGLHGVTLLCGNEFIVLSAPSGTGKTTLGKLLEQYCDAVVINGDFALLHPTEDGVIFEPTPFCGTSKRCLDFRPVINRVVFLSQAKANTWYELSGREALSSFMSNAFIPTGDQSMQQAVQENVMKCLSGMKAEAYAFAPTKEAAETFYKHIRA